MSNFVLSFGKFLLFAEVMDFCATEKLLERGKIIPAHLLRFPRVSIAIYAGRSYLKNLIVYVTFTVFIDLIFYILISTRQIVALFKYTAMTQLLQLCFLNLVFKLLNVFLDFLSSLRSLNAGRTGRGAWGGKITLNKMALVTTLHESVSNIQPSTRVSTKYKPEMVSDFCNVPKSKRVRF